MSYIVYTMRFSYHDIMAMEHCERQKWLELSDKLNKDKKKAMDAK